MARPSFAPPQLIGIACALGSFGCLAWAFTFGYEHFLTGLAVIFADRRSVGILIAVQVLLYVLLISIRASLEPQYARYVQGRFQEAIYLRNPALLMPLIPLCSVSLSYYQSGFSLPLDFISWGGFMVSIYGFVKNVSGAWLRPVERDGDILYEPKKHESVGAQPARGSTADDVLYAQAEVGPRIIRFPKSGYFFMHGCLFHGPTNALLQDPASSFYRKEIRRVRKFRFLNATFQLPEELKPYRKMSFIHMRARGGLLYSEKKVRLNSDLDKVLFEPESRVSIQKTTYFDFVCSNELTRYVVAKRESQPGSGEDMYRYVRGETNGLPITLHDSVLSNHMGGGTIAITSGGLLILSKQGRLALASTGLLAPTGSGSFDWRDQRQCGRFDELVVRGIERELREECKYGREDVSETMLLGYGRDMRRGGKPDFYAVSLVNSRPEVDRTEYGLIDQHELVDVRSPTEAALRKRLRELEAEIAKRSSEALLLNLHLLHTADSSILAKILHFMRNA